MLNFRLVLEFLNSILWDYILLFGLVGVGVFLSIKLKFPQATKMFPALGKIIMDIKNKVQVPEGRMSPFQALSTAIAAQVGTGNIVGVATAIASGGPGAAFWMLLSAFFGMATIFAEAILAQVFRETKNGELVGGPAYYIKNGLKAKWLAYIFAVLCIIALGIVGIMVQANSIVNSMNGAFGFQKVWVTVGLVAAVGMVLTGGMSRIAGFTEKVVPVMAFLYIFGSLCIIILNGHNFIPAIKAIFVGAFNPKAIGGGILGISVQQAIRYGLSRGLFSNEAGMGSTPHSHAVANTDHPAEQGCIAMIGVFISTFLICLSTVVVNLTSGAYDMNIPASVMATSDTTMTQMSFALTFGKFGKFFGVCGAGFLSIALTFFALTTIVGWYFFAEANVKFLVGSSKAFIAVFKFIVLGFIVLSGKLNPQLVWQLADFFMGLMAIPNIIALFLLSNVAKKVLDDYESCKSKGIICWDFRFE